MGYYGCVHIGLITTIVYVLRNKMKKKQYHIVGTVPKSNRKILERVKISTVTYKNLTVHLPLECHKRTMNSVKS